MKHVSFGLWFLIACTLAGQPLLNADSLLRLIPEMEGQEARFDAYYQAVRTLNNQDPARAIQYAHKALELAQEIGDGQRLGAIYNELGFYHNHAGQLDSIAHYWTLSLSHYQAAGNVQKASAVGANVGVSYLWLGDYPTAEQYIREALGVQERLGDTSAMINGISNLGLIRDYQGDYPEALRYYYEALELAEEAGATRQVGRQWLNIGAAQSMVKDYGRAMSAYRKALAIIKKLEDKVTIGEVYGNIGLIHDYLDQNDSALYYHRLALEEDRKSNNREHIAADYNNMAVVYEKQGRNELAEEYYLRALELKKELGNKERLASSYANLGKFYLETGNLPKAKAYLDEGLPLARSIGNLENESLLLKYYADYFREKGNYREALSYMEAHKAASDSLLNQSKAEAIIEIDTRYQAGKARDSLKLRESELLLSREQEALRAGQLRFAFAVLAGLLAVAALLGWFLHSTRRKKQAIESMNAELVTQREAIGLLNRELNHRVKNNLQFITTLLQMQGRRLKDAEAREAVLESENRVRALSLAHQQLFHKEADTLIDFRQYLAQLVENLQFSLRPALGQARVSVNCPGLVVQAEQATRLGLVVNELITNSAKHAFGQQPHPAITIGLERSPDGRMTLVYRDNGAGMHPEEHGAKDSLGLRLIESLVEQLNGQWAIQNRNGFVFEASFPIDQP
ncbi:MAG: tetratricopeptide repeat protein [Lewinellaceae bacterium]|nr:tetratricopeptide repeat protein [Lewinellaceae bacterium]